jgi:hypothetical protein
MTTFGSSQDLQASFVNTEGTTVQVGRTRVHGVYIDSLATAGNLILRDGGASGTIKYKIRTPAKADPIVINFPGPILFKTDVYSAFTTEHIHSVTVMHSGGSNS